MESIFGNLFEQSARIIKTGGAMIVFMAIIKVESVIAIAEKYGFYYKTTGIWHKLNPMPRNMNLHFVNSTESWIYFTYKKRTGTFNNDGAVIHDFVETSLTMGNEKKHGMLASGENNLHESGEINQKKSKEKSHYQF